MVPTEDQAEEDGDSAAASRATFDYLLSMAIYSLTWERVQALEEEANEQVSTALGFVAGQQGRLLPVYR